MKIRYFTEKGSVYLVTRSEVGEYWVRQEPDGSVHPLAGAVHLGRSRLEELIREYPATMLDKTFCFDVGAESEFFEDAKREKFNGLFELEPTVIFFLVKHGDRFALGSSSEIIKIEKEEEQ